MAAFFVVPGEGRAVVAEVAREGRHVVGGVGEAQHVVVDEGAGGRRAEWPVVIGRGDNGELFNHVQLEVSTWYFLSGNVIKAEGIKIPQQTCRVVGGKPVFFRQEHSQCVRASHLRYNCGNHCAHICHRCNFLECQHILQVLGFGSLLLIDPKARSCSEIGILMLTLKGWHRLPWPKQVATPSGYRSRTMVERLNCLTFEQW